MRIAFLHPDLGIGGAERLVVDAAVALQQKGHDVKMFTNHYDSSHSFKETEQLGKYFCCALSLNSSQISQPLLAGFHER